jgi:hypothetical protein
MFASAAVEVSAAAVGAARLPNTIPEPRRAALDLRKVLRSMFMEGWRFAVGFGVRGCEWK